MHLSLFWKIMAAFVIVLAVGVGDVTLIAERTTTSEFQHYMFGGGSGPEQFVVPLADYYAQTGSWNGVQNLVGSGGMMGGLGMGRGGLGEQADALSLRTRKATLWPTRRAYRVGR